MDDGNLEAVADAMQKQLHALEAANANDWKLAASAAEELAAKESGLSGLQTEIQHAQLCLLKARTSGDALEIERYYHAGIFVRFSSSTFPFFPSLLLCWI